MAKETRLCPSFQLERPVQHARIRVHLHKVFSQVHVEDQFHPQDVFKSESATCGISFELQVGGYEGGWKRVLSLSLPLLSPLALLYSLLQPLQLWAFPLLCALVHLGS